jgi:hypothetical protein
VPPFIPNPLNFGYSLVEKTLQIRAQCERETSRTFDETWVVFDRDSFLPDKFNSAIFQAIAAGTPVRCAWSNEAFELWYCLHFCYVNHAMPRSDYDYKDMIEQELSARMGRPFSYRKNHSDMYQTFKTYGNQQQAIAWAKMLAAAFARQENFAGQNPCTQVYLLVEALMP